MLWLCVPILFRVKRLYGPRSRSHRSFEMKVIGSLDILSCPLHGFLLIWRKVKRQGHMGRLLSCPLRGFVLIWPNHFVCVIHTTREGAMCCAPCSGRKVKVIWTIWSSPFSGRNAKGQGHMGNHCDPDNTATILQVPLHFVTLCPITDGFSMWNGYCFGLRDDKHIQIPFPFWWDKVVCPPPRITNTSAVQMVYKEGNVSSNVTVI